MAWYRPNHLWLLALLIACSLFLFWKVCVEDYGPFDGWINFHYTTLLDRQKLGYCHLPEHHADPSRPGGGYFNLYANNWQNDGRYGYCVYDEPYWPDGDPGRGSGNPLPPMVRRHEIRAMTPEIPTLVLAIGWLCWACLLVRRLLKRLAWGRGFDVLPPGPVH